MYEWQIILRDLVDRLGFNLFVMRKVATGGREYLRADGKIIKVKIGDGAIDPEKVKYCYLDHNMLQALTDEIAKKGIKPQQGYLEGKLEATISHIKDLRALLKFKP